MRSDLKVCYPDGRNRIWNCAVVANICNPLAIGSEGGKSEDQSCFSYEVCWGQPRLTILCTKSTNALKKLKQKWNENIYLNNSVWIVGCTHSLIF